MIQHENQRAVYGRKSEGKSITGIAQILGITNIVLCPEETSVLDKENKCHVLVLDPYFDFLF